MTGDRRRATTGTSPLRAATLVSLFGIFLGNIAIKPLGVSIARHRQSRTANPSPSAFQNQEGRKAHQRCPHKRYPRGNSVVAR